MVLRHAHELRGSFHWDAEAHRIHGNSSDAAMMIVVGTDCLCLGRQAQFASRLLRSHRSSSRLGIRN